MNTKNKNILCFCNSIDESTVEDSIVRGGARTLAEVFDKCGAGTGPCGGSCREEIKSLIEKNTTQTKNAAPHWVPPRGLTEAISLFNRRYYWETHEVLENMWLEESGKTKIFYQGLIQAAASFYHVLNANPKGVIRLAEEASQKLRTFLPAYEGIPLTGLVSALEVLTSQAKEILGSFRSGFDYDLLPTLSLGEDMDRSTIMR